MLHRTAAEYGIGLVFVIAGMLCGVAAASRIPQRFGIAAVVLAGSVFALLAGSMLPLLLVFGTMTPLSLFGPTVLVAFGIGFAMPAGQAGIVGLVPELAGTASGVSGFLQMLFAAVFAHIVALPSPRRGVSGFLQMLFAAVFAHIVALTVESAGLGPGDDLRRRTGDGGDFRPGFRGTAPATEGRHAVTRVNLPDGNVVHLWSYDIRGMREQADKFATELSAE